MYISLFNQHKPWLLSLLFLSEDVTSHFRAILSWKWRFVLSYFLAVQGLVRMNKSSACCVRFQTFHFIELQKVVARCEGLSA